MRSVVNTEVIPSELKDRDQWVVWKYVDDGKRKMKVPYTCDKQPADVVNGMFNTFGDVVNTYTTHAKLSGIGFVLNQDVGLVGIDIDGHIPMEIIEQFDTYTEVTPSGNGCRLWLQSDLQLDRNKFNCDGYNIEIYNDKRYFTVTGDVINDAHVKIGGVELESFYESLFTKITGGKVREGEASKAGKSTYKYTDSDKVLLAKIWKLDGYGKLHQRRFAGDVSVDGGDTSKSRYYLIKCLYNWCKNKEQVIRIMLNSNLVDAKWLTKRNGMPFIEWEVQRIVGV